jgi:hypothetical protein
MSQRSYTVSSGIYSIYGKGGFPMSCCENKCGASCGLAVFVGILFGIAVGVLFAFALIPNIVLLWQ